MLQRVQLLLDTETRERLRAVAMQEKRSLSVVARKVLKEGLAKKKIQKKRTGGEFLRWLSEHAKKGPGDSEYDKYAYDY